MSSNLLGLFPFFCGSKEIGGINSKPMQNLSGVTQKIVQSRWNSPLSDSVPSAPALQRVNCSRPSQVGPRETSETESRPPIDASPPIPPQDRSAASPNLLPQQQNSKGTSPPLFFFLRSPLRAAVERGLSPNRNSTLAGVVPAAPVFPRVFYFLVKPNVIAPPCNQSSLQHKQHVPLSNPPIGDPLFPEPRAAHLTLWGPPIFTSEGQRAPLEFGDPVSKKRTDSQNHSSEKPPPQCVLPRQFSAPCSKAPQL